MGKPLEMIIRSDSYDETLKIASVMAAFLKPGDVLCLDGDLGAGKTAFAAGIAAGLGMEGAVSSPTFTIMHEYIRNNTSSGTFTGDHAIRRINHFDVYRLSGADEFTDLGFEEFLDNDDAIAVIEWADRISAALGKACIRVVFHRDDVMTENVNNMKRVLEITFTAEDERFKDLITELTSSGYSVSGVGKLE